MISDDKRIEAAKFLRGCDCTCAECDECKALSEELFGKEYTICDMDVPLEKVANLIDRQTCTIVNSWQEITPGLGELDLDDMCGFELSCGHEVQGYEKPKYCSECGAVVVGED